MIFKKLSIIVPVFNEENTIEQVLKEINGVSLNYNLEKEIIVVDDGSFDKTKEILKNLKINNVKVFFHKQNMGKGFAIRTALSKVTGDVVIIQDADLEYVPDEYNLLLKPIIENNAKVVFGSRRLKKSNKKHSAFRFYLGGIIITWFTNLLYSSNLTDEPTCYKMFTAEVINSLDLKCENFEFCPEVTAKVLKKNITIVEVPISYFPRSINEGKKIRWKDGIQAIWWLFKLKFFKN